MRLIKPGLLVGFAILSAFALPRATSASTFVWKVTGSDNDVLYLGGSWHALRQSDYPLPAAFSRALDASAKLVLEVDPQQMRAADKSLSQAAKYPAGDSLKKHVDPRTYNYLRRLFAL